MNKLIMIALLALMSAWTVLAQTAPSTQPSASDVLDRLLTPDNSGAPAPLQPSRPRNAPAAPAASGAVVREGSYLVDRTGRLTRSPDGQSWLFTFESDGRALQEAPMQLLPNLKLMAIEDAARASGRDLRYRVTGMVTEYRGKNYLLLEKVIVLQDERF